MGFDGFLVPDWAKPYVGWVVGMDWPEGDESGCFRLADACVAAAHRLVEGTAADQPWSASKVGAEWDGAAHLAFAEHVAQVAGGRVADLVGRLINTAVALNGVGVQIQYAKYMIEATVWLLIVQLWQLVKLAVVTKGASLALIPPRVQMARMTVAQIARLTLSNMAVFAGIVAGMDGGVQLLQVAQGRRDELDLRQLGMSALSGGAMGGLMGVLSGGLTRLATPALRAGLSRAEMSVAEKLLSAVVSSLPGQAAQFAVAGGLTTAGSMLVEGNFSWDLLFKGITSSALGADGQYLPTILSGRSGTSSVTSVPHGDPPVLGGGLDPFPGSGGPDAGSWSGPGPVADVRPVPAGDPGPRMSPAPGSVPGPERGTVLSRVPDATRQTAVPDGPSDRQPQVPARDPDGPRPQAAPEQGPASTHGTDVAPRSRTPDQNVPPAVRQVPETASTGVFRQRDDQVSAGGGPQQVPDRPSGGGSQQVPERGPDGGSREVPERSSGGGAQQVPERPSGGDVRQVPEGGSAGASVDAGRRGDGAGTVAVTRQEAPGETSPSASRIERLLNHAPGSGGATPSLQAANPVPQAADRAVQAADPAASVPLGASDDSLPPSHSPSQAGDGSSSLSRRGDGSSWSFEGGGGSRDGVSSRPPFDFERFYNDPRWWDDATEFEQRLGAYYFNDALTVDAARTALRTLRDVLMELVPKQPGESVEAFAVRVESVFFRDDPASAGQVGTRAGVTVDDLLAHGNLRELVTAFYNGAYYNRDNPNTFSDVLLRVMDDGDWDRARGAGLDVAEVRRAQHQLDGRIHRPVLGWLESRVMEGSFTFTRDPFGTGNVGMLSERGVRDVAEVIMSQHSRENRSEEEIRQLGLVTTPAHYEGLGVPLGRFERAFVEEHVGGRLDPDTPLPWREGGTAHETTASRWARKAMGEGFPVVDGVSGTTAKMLTAVKFLGLGSKMTERFLGALMGWMLPGRDHSLLEIFRGAQIAGVGGMRLEPASRPTAVDLYRNLPGLDLGTLRREILPDGMFPHEYRYFQRATDPSGLLATKHSRTEDIIRDIWPQLETGRVTEPYLAEWLKRSGIDPNDPNQVRALGERLSPAHLMALTVYPRPGHSLFNNVTRAQLWTGGVSEALIRHHIANKAYQHVRQYLDDIAADSMSNPLPAELYEPLHLSADGKGYDAALQREVHSYIDTVRRADETRLREAVERLEAARDEQRKAWNELKEHLGRAMSDLWEAPDLWEAVDQWPAPDLWKRMHERSDMAYDWTGGLSELVVQQRLVSMDKAYQLARDYLDNLARSTVLQLPEALRSLLYHPRYVWALSSPAESYVNAVRRTDKAMRAVTEVGDVRAARKDVREAWQRIVELLTPAMSRVVKELGWHIDMMYDALAQLPAVGSPENPVQAYRGDWMTPVHSPIYGSKLYPYGTTREFLSMSRSLKVAIEYMAWNPGGDRKVLTVYRLTGQQAKDISLFSSPRLKEILLPPHSHTHRVDDPALVAEIREKADKLISDMLRRGLIYKAPKYEIVVMEEG